jgi:hypothetical protein
LWLTRKTDKRQYDTSRFSFSSRKVVSESVPNSVVFSYDAHAASPTDTILIQQSWDKRLQQQVFYNQKQATSIYYYPGFFKAKLLVNGQVVKEHNLIINTNGWLPLIKRGNNIPIYFKEENALTGEALHLPIEKLLASNVSLQPEVPTVEYYNVRSFADLQSDDFKFEAVLKNSFREGTAACQQTNVQILCEGNFISIPLSTKGCISDLSLFFLGNKKDGKKEDLSDFGCDFSSWVNLRCEVKNKMCFIYINDKLVYEATLQAVPEKITGIVFSFEGTGSVDMVKLSKSDGSIIYSENFEN